MGMFAYFPDSTHDLVAAVAIAFNLLTTDLVCRLPSFGSGDNFFAYCGPDYGYSKTITIIIVFVLPALYFIYKFFRSKKSKPR